MLDETTAVAIKRVIARHIEQEMKAHSPQDYVTERGDGAGEDVECGVGGVRVIDFERIEMHLYIRWNTYGIG